MLLGGVEEKGRLGPHLQSLEKADRGANSQPGGAQTIKSEVVHCLYPITHF